MLEVLDSGAIQVQLVTAMEPSSQEQTSYTWEIEIRNQNTLVFMINWAEPDLISATGVDRDSIRIYLEDASQIITCQTSDSQAQISRLLRDLEVLIPDETILRVEIPPQLDADTFEHKFVNYDEMEATELLFFGVGLSSILAVPSQLLYDGILAAQIVSHIPLNNVNLPQVSMAFMKQLNKIVSFNTKDPYEIFRIKFTQTPPLNTNFDWMGYESMNFLENIGLIAFLFIIILLRQLIGSMFFLLTKIFKFCGCIRY